MSQNAPRSLQATAQALAAGTSFSLELVEAAIARHERYGEVLGA